MRKEETRGGSRAELIRLARESCSMQLSTGSVDNRGYERAVPVSRMKTRTIQRDGSDRRDFKTGFTILRYVCAVVLLIVIIAADTLNIEYAGVKSVDINKSISSNEVIDQAEEFFSTLSKDKIVEVFNRLR